MKNNEPFDATILLSACYLGYTSFGLLKKLLRIQDKVKWVEKQPIQLGDEKQMLNKGLGQRVALLKLHCTKSKSYKVQLDVGVLENIYNKFPLNQNIFQFLKQCENLSAAGDRWKSKQFTQPLQMGKAVQINIFQIKHEYKQDEKSLWQWVYFGFASIGALLIDILIKIISFHPSGLLIKGPTLGKLITTLQLVTDSPIIVQCQLNGREVIPKIMGLTKENIIDYYKDEAFKTKMEFIMSISLLYIFRKTIYNSIKTFLNKFKKIFEQLFIPIAFRKKGKILDVEVAQELNCIICMIKCRNIVFQKCRHLSVCDGCYQSHREDMSRCPLCRQQVGDEILFVQELDEIPLKEEK